MISAALLSSAGTVIADAFEKAKTADEAGNIQEAEKWWRIKAMQGNKMSVWAQSHIGNSCSTNVAHRVAPIFSISSL